MSITCPYCKSENNDDAVWCAKCNRNMVDWSSGEVRSADDIRKDNRTGDNLPDHLWMSIVVTIFCCQALGVIAIVYSVIARVETARGNREYAKYASDTASKWIRWAFGTGIIGWIILLFIPLILKFIGRN